MNSNLISPVRVAGIGVVPLDGGTVDALNAGQSGTGFDWQKAVNALISAGASIAIAQMQANAARNAFNNAQSQGYNLYQTGYNANAAGSITQYLPYIAVGIIALVLILKK